MGTSRIRVYLECSFEKNYRLELTSMERSRVTDTGSFQGSHWYISQTESGTPLLYQRGGSAKYSCAKRMKNFGRQRFFMQRNNWNCSKFEKSWCGISITNGG